jgi:flagellar basal-body rod modification protein FlgD
MTIAATSGVGAIQPTSKSTVSSAFGLGKDDFFKLFLSQLANQDPMNPVDNKTFIDQLAQFSMIDTLQSVKTALEGTQLAQASNMLGKEIQGVDIAGKAITGVVDHVLQVDGKLLLKIGDRAVSPDSVDSVTATQVDTTASAATTTPA